MEMEMQCAKCEAMEFMLRKAWRRQEQLESALRITEKHLDAFLIKDLTKKRQGATPFCSAPATATMDVVITMLYEDVNLNVGQQLFGQHGC